jgi:hypothetical protein
MKIILSRKGFDSANGGYPNIIDEEGNFIVFPILENENEIYSDIKTKNGILYHDILTKRYPNNKIPKNQFCHCDPNLGNYFFGNEDISFRASFGQVDSSQSHLEKNIDIGDIFLFFSWFKDNEENDKHIIYGYMQIGSIIYPQHPQKNKPDDLKNKTKETIQKQFPCLKSQPHWINKDNKYDDIKNKKINNNNCIYLASDFLEIKEESSIKTESLGRSWGMFKFNEELVLSKGPTRSKWKIKGLPDNIKISYTYEKDGFIQSRRGQELIIDPQNNNTNYQVIKWAKDLIIKCRV